MQIDFFAWTLATIGSLSVSQGLNVNLDFYVNMDCAKASTITPSASLNLSTCFVTPGLVSLHYDTVPCAGGGTVYPFLFKDSSCGTQEDILDFYKTGTDFHCLSDFKDVSTGSIMLSCNDTPEDPVATSTISIAPVATGASAPTSTSTSGSGSKGSKGSDSNDSNDQDPTGWNSLSSGAHIGIIVGAAALVFLVLVVFCAGALRRRRKNRRYENEAYYPGGRYPMAPPYQSQQPPPMPQKSPMEAVTSPASTYHSASMNFGSPPHRSPSELYNSQVYGMPVSPPVSPPPRQEPSELYDSQVHRLPVSPSVSPPPLAGNTSESAYAQVLDNAVRTARQHSASGLFDTSIHVDEMVNFGDELSPDIISLALPKHNEEWKSDLGAAGELYVCQ